MNTPSGQLDVNFLDELWRARHQPPERDALEHALQAALEHAPEYGVLWRAARLAHFRALTGDDEAAAAAHYEHGKTLAQRAVELNHHDVEGHFWLGVNLLESSRRKGWMQAASALRPAEQHIERAVNQDETYEFAGPVRMAARIMHLKPLLLGGSVDRALGMYRRALQIAPHNSTTLLYYAEALLADQQKKTARETLHHIIEDPTDADWRAEQAHDRRAAQALLTQMDAAQ